MSPGADARGKNEDEWIPCILESEGPSKEYRKNWDRLIQKIYEVDPLTYYKSQGRIKIISFMVYEGFLRRLLQELKTAPGDR